MSPPTLTTSLQAMATSVTHSASIPIVSSTLINGDDTEDLDFVGFSSTPQIKKLLQAQDLHREAARPDPPEAHLSDTCKSPEVLSPTGDKKHLLTFPFLY